ncbi:serine/threonine-protein kinase [Rhizohabitans arisaemae]|uniref:serine/threonine-protein kinase n=1 Tax=Rhizohabitans arisaemae TaxID=2720610 RepID=UPI0024B124FA|nr:serine/threonine-protein kinase [Rhizohabitans arisaemae]
MLRQGTMLAGRYRLASRLGAGGMGEVWRGEDVVLGRIVAIKVLLAGLMEDPGFAERFRGEARAMATVNHSGVVDIYDYGTSELEGGGATAYLVMEYVDGEALDRLLGRVGRISTDATLELIAQAAEALHAAHEKGIVHRDVKPGNLMIRSDGTLVLTDFGIARRGGSAHLTDVGMVLGTAAYCAPEQAEGREITPAADMYALGVVAYECLAGYRPFDGESSVTIALKHIREAPPPLPGDIPEAARKVVERALEKDPSARWATASEMAHATRRALEMSVFAQQGSPLKPAEGPPVPGVPETGTQVRVTRSTWAETDASAPALPQTEVAVPGGGRRARRRNEQTWRKPTLVVAGAALLAVLVGGFAFISFADRDGGPGNGVGVNPAGTTRPLGTATPIKTPKPTAKPAIRTTRPPRPTPTPTATTIKPSASPTKKPPPTAAPSTTKPPVSPSPSPSPSQTLRPSAQVPSLIGLTREEAEAGLRKAGFKPIVDYGGDPDGKCRVVTQLIPAGELRQVGTRVTVIIDGLPGCEAA